MGEVDKYVVVHDGKVISKPLKFEDASASIAASVASEAVMSAASVARISEAVLRFETVYENDDSFSEYTICRVGE